MDSYPQSVREEGCEVGGEQRSRGKEVKVEGAAVRQIWPLGPQKGGGQHIPAREKNPNKQKYKKNLSLNHQM